MLVKQYMNMRFKSTSEGKKKQKKKCEEHHYLATPATTIQAKSYIEKIYMKEVKDVKSNVPRV